MSKVYSREGMSKYIAIIEDEPDISNLVALHLKKSNFEVREFVDAGSFMETIETKLPDLIILDLMLPDADGLELCRQLKNSGGLVSSIPIIMLTAKTEEMDRVLGLELGADDYVGKPFSPKELVARVKAVLRRSVEYKEPEKIKVGNKILIDSMKYQVTVDGDLVNLTTTEFKILEILACRKGNVFSREQILNSLWGSDKVVIDRTVDVHIKHLRSKLGEEGKIIKNIRGIGYKIEE